MCSDLLFNLRLYKSWMGSSHTLHVQALEDLCCVPSKCRQKPTATFSAQETGENVVLKRGRTPNPSSTMSLNASKRTKILLLRW
jgi:hypothetical protein